jgi:poly-gamma-glutamate synthesis protein (capsule biosynthesis protein)
MTAHKKQIAAFILVIVLSGLINAGFVLKNRSGDVSVNASPNKNAAAKAPAGDFNDVPPPPPPENPRVTIAAVGDVMMHEGQIWSGYDAGRGRYDYTSFFREVREEISSADIAMANLETTLGGKEQKYTGYPRFSSPDELADALKYAGFDVVVTSNNHCMDRGEKGLLRTLKVLKDRGLQPIGTSESSEARRKVFVKEANGLKVAFLAYTYGTNGIPVPEDKPYLVNLIEEKAILSDLARARECADAVVIYLHFGQEYRREPSEEQKRLARLLLESGADVIIGSHPHVLQPGEWIEVEDPAGGTVKKYAAYSLGNFISAQRFPHTEEGVILKVALEKDSSLGRVYIKELTEIPTRVDKFKSDGRMRYVVRPGKKV